MVLNDIEAIDTNIANLILTGLSEAERREIAAALEGLGSDAVEMIGRAIYVVATSPLARLAATTILGTMTPVGKVL